MSFSTVLAIPLQKFIVDDRLGPPPYGGQLLQRVSLLNISHSSAGLNKPTLVSISKTVSFYNYNEPTQAHLALTGDPTEMM